MPATILSTAILIWTRTVLSESDSASAISRDDSPSCRLSRNTVRQRSGKSFMRRRTSSSTSASINRLSGASSLWGGGISVDQRDGNLLEREAAAARTGLLQIPVRLVARDDVEVGVDVFDPPQRDAGLPDGDEDVAHDLAAGLPVAQKIVGEPENAPVIEIIENPESVIVVLAYGNKQILKFFFLLHVRACSGFHKTKLGNFFRTAIYGSVKIPRRGPGAAAAKRERDRALRTVPLPAGLRPDYFPSSPLRISLRRILPLMVLGSDSTNSITRGYL